jgi:hypothetical protein
MRRLLALLVVLPFLAPVASAETVTTVAHPSVQAQPESGRYVKDLGLQGTRLYIGHGNYSANTGPIDLAWVDTVTGATGVDRSTPTEELNTFRTIDGRLYAPWIDPKGCGTCTPVNGGYSTTASDVHAFQAAHVWDVAKVGSDLFIAGTAAYNDGAVIYRSTDGGATWTRSLAEASPGGATGWERFYWMGVIGGKLYAQAAHKDYTGAGTSSSDMFPMRVWDGTRWAKARGTLPLISEASNVESFAGKIYTTRGIYNGRRVTALGAPFTVQDFHQSGGRLYAIGSAGELAYTTGGAWVTIPGAFVSAGKSALSVAVVGGQAYVGTRDGLVERRVL